MIDKAIRPRLELAADVGEGETSETLTGIGEAVEIDATDQLGTADQLADADADRRSTA